MKHGCWLFVASIVTFAGFPTDVAFAQTVKVEEQIRVSDAPTLTPPAAVAVTEAIGVSEMPVAPAPVAIHVHRASANDFEALHPASSARSRARRSACPVAPISR